MRDVILSKSSDSSSSGSEIGEIVDNDDVSIDDTVVVMQNILEGESEELRDEMTTHAYSF